MIEDFAEKLAGLADIYINDAFAVCHRAHASVEAITRFCKDKGAGFLVKNEITYFTKALEESGAATCCHCRWCKGIR